MGGSHSFQAQKQQPSSSSPRQGRVSTPASSPAVQDHPGRLPCSRHALANIPIARPTPGTIETRESGTSLPHALKRKMENLSGLSLQDVQVHYNSPKPALAWALAYTQGSAIYLGPKQERHLAHEVWHVVQQKQGRVAPTRQTSGMSINDERVLEQEASLVESGVPGVEKLAYSMMPSTLAVRSVPVAQYFGEGTPEEVAAGTKFEELLQTFSEDRGLIAYYQERLMIYEAQLKRLSPQKSDVLPKASSLPSSASKQPVPVESVSRLQPKVPAVPPAISKQPALARSVKEQAKGPSLRGSKPSVSAKQSGLQPKTSQPSSRGSNQPLPPKASSLKKEVALPPLAVSKPRPSVPPKLSKEEEVLPLPDVSKPPVSMQSSSLKEEEEEILLRSRSLALQEEEEEEEGPTLNDEADELAEQIRNIRSLLVQLQKELEQCKTQILDLYPTIKLSSLDPYYVPLVDDVLGRDIQIVENPRRMGKEVEVPSLTITPKSIPSENGQVLAYTKATELGLPVIKMETEGADRGSLTVEVIYGPLLSTEYASKEFEQAVVLLNQHFQKPVQATFADRIQQYNLAVSKIDKRYTLVITSIGNKAKTSAKKLTKNIQTNVSIPYSALGDAEATKLLDLLFAGEDKQVIVFYDKAREVSNQMVGTFYKGKEKNTASLLTHILFQNDIYAFYRIQFGKETKVSKHFFHVMIKASPEDAIFSILSVEEVASLLVWLNGDGGATLLTAARKMYPWVKEQEAALVANIKSTVASLKHACTVRLQEGEQQLVRTRGKIGERDNPVSVTKGGEKITHHVPRPSNRIPVSRDLEGRGYIVIEQRSAGHRLNESEFARL